MAPVLVAVVISLVLILTMIAIIPRRGSARPESDGALPAPAQPVREVRLAAVAEPPAEPPASPSADGAVREPIAENNPAPQERPADPPPRPAPASEPPEPAPAKRPREKPTDPVVRAIDAGVEFVLRRQLENGGWCEGDVPALMPSDRAGVAHTALNALALLRTGGGKDLGSHAKSVARAVKFVCAAVEKADPASLGVATPQGTAIQMKLGPAIDTFLAMWLLAEVRGRIPDEAGNKRAAEALSRVIAKVERNQNPDGSWYKGFAASSLGPAVAARALSRAREAGASVDDAVLRRAQSHALDAAATRGTVWKLGGSYKTPPAAALPDGLKPGMPLWLDAAATHLGTVQSTPRAGRSGERPAEADRRARAAAEEIIKDLKGPEWVNYLDHVDTFRGGEEYLSFLFVSEALADRGGKDWDLWRGRVGRRLVRQQHRDGSWSAEHCVCGGNFCTPAAVLTLLADPANSK
jgi:hypothetical protein